jgi:hypothetical protein
MSASPDGDGIRRLAAAVASTAPRNEVPWLFVGWNAADRPMAARDPANLSADALRAFQQFRRAGLWPRQVPFASLEAVEYAFTGPAVDFADSKGQVAEDQIQYVVLDENGERREVHLGELALLEGIVQAAEPWQAALGGNSAELAQSAIRYHTVLLPHPDGPIQRGLAILFRPTLSASGNEAAFGAFVRYSLSRLLVLDESQPDGRRKGYLEAAARHAGLSPDDVSGLLQWLRRLGFVDFEDAWIESLQRRRAGAVVAALRVLRKMGMVDVGNDRLKEMAEARPSYDLDALDTSGLVGLAEAMYWAARSKIPR